MTSGSLGDNVISATMERCNRRRSSSREDRLRIQHERLENERRYQQKQFESEINRLADSVGQNNKEQELLRKQHERLENEKKYYKKNSYLTSDRHLTLPSEKPKAKSCHTTPDTSNVKSKLFDFEKSAPRSRRQLAAASNRTPDTSSRGSPMLRPSPVRAIETHKVSHTDLVNHLNVKRDSISGAVSGTDHSAQPTPRNEDRSIEKTALEKEASKRATGHKDHGVSFDEERDSSKRASRAQNKTRPSIQIDDVDADDDTVKLQALYNKAIETVQNTDELLLDEAAQGSSIKRKRGSISNDPAPKSGLDVTALQELEAILNDARNYTSRKSSKDDHSRLDVGSNRAQKKRIQHLEQVLKRLNPYYGTVQDVDPMKTLQCSYLRLSKSNVETLESMLKDTGRDPGIHIHSDISNIDIWDGLKEERTDVKPEDKASKKSLSSRKTVKT